MAAPNPADRIISHMNNDHQDSLVRYLEHYCGVSSFTARNARLFEVTLSHMVIRTTALPETPHHRAPKNNRYTVPFDPPLKAWSELRERVVAMDKDCLTALKRSDVTIKHYFVPKGFEAVSFAAAAFLFISMFRRENFNLNAGSGAWWPWTLVGSYVPGLFRWLYAQQPKIFWGLLSVHTLEALVLDLTRLQKHSVPRGSGLWWKFVLGHTIEGVGSFLRFDRTVKQMKAEKDKAKH